MRRLTSPAAALCVCLTACGAPSPDPPADEVPEGCPRDAEDVPEPALHTPRWAFEPWISKDISSTADSYAFVEGFRSRGIPVGVLVLDSPWETHYNTFVPSPSRYPDFPRLSADLHEKGVRLVLWITPFVNKNSLDLEAGGDRYEGPAPNFAEAERCRLLVNDGETYVWWKGLGGAVDLLSGRARAWWHRQQDPILPLIDGWKLDFGDSYVLSDEVKTAAGLVPHQAYAEAYYRDFLAYGVQRRGPEFTTMVRGFDESYQFRGRFHARREHAPVTWAGDNRRDAVGLRDALDHMFRSAKAGYAVVGSDIGGYLDFDDRTMATVPPDWDVFSRWTAIGALSPFMQLHGRANLAPWTVPERPGEMVALYRYWSVLHHELVPFFYSLAQEADRGGAPILRPVGEEASWPGDYRYHLGEALLVAPLVGDEPTAGTRDVVLPGGAAYLDWWDPAAAPRAGGTTLRGYSFARDRGRVPLFLREGAIVPLAVSSDVTGLGRSASARSLTVLVYPGAEERRFVLHEEDGETTLLSAARQGLEATVAISRAPRDVVLRVHGAGPARSVTEGGAPLSPVSSVEEALAAPGRYHNDAALGAVWLRIGAGSAGRRVVITR